MKYCRNADTRESYARCKHLRRWRRRTAVYVKQWSANTRSQTQQATIYWGVTLIVVRATHARTHGPTDGRTGNARGPAPYAYVWRRHGYDRSRKTPEQAPRSKAASDETERQRYRDSGTETEKQTERWRQEDGEADNKQVGWTCCKRLVFTLNQSSPDIDIRRRH